jgi:prophage tail gpP-like protein
VAFFPIDPEGKPDDRVRLELDDTLVLVLQNYEVSQRFLTVPSAFAARLGDGSTVVELITSYPPNSTYALYVGDVPQHTGILDGYSTDDSGGGTVVTFTGRDYLAPMHDAHAIVDKSFGNVTYRELAETCLELSGIVEYTLFPSNDANRLVQGGIGQGNTKKPLTTERVGVTVVAAGGTSNLPGSPAFEQAEAKARAASKATGESITVVVGAPTSVDDQIAAAVKAAATKNRSTGSTDKKLQIKAGETFYGFFKKECDRAGLFIFAAVAPNTFVLTEPNAKQAPRYRLRRQRGLDRNAVNILSHRHKNDTSQRHAKYVVHGRGGSGKGGREKVRGEFVDDEMVTLGFSKPWAKEDQDAKSTAQAEYYARRACAEARRQGWELVYVVEGHSAVSLVGGGRAVWAVDTIVDVQDDELGIYGPHWIEGVTFRGTKEGTTTEITLMRPEDLVFGEGEFLAPKVKKKRGGRRRRTAVFTPDTEET